jgi:hypothetical protein
MTTPESFLCPLTLEVMRDPVIDPEGNSVRLPRAGPCLAAVPGFVLLAVCCWKQ